MYGQFPLTPFYFFHNFNCFHCGFPPSVQFWRHTNGRCHKCTVSSNGQYIIESHSTRMLIYNNNNNNNCLEICIFFVKFVLVIFTITFPRFVGFTPVFYNKRRVCCFYFTVVDVSFVVILLLLYIQSRFSLICSAYVSLCVSLCVRTFFNASIPQCLTELNIVFLFICLF